MTVCPPPVARALVSLCACAAAAMAGVFAGQLHDGGLDASGGYWAMAGSAILSAALSGNRLTTTPEGALIVNIFLVREVAWSEVAEVEFGRGASVALRLRSGARLPITVARSSMHRALRWFTRWRRDPAHAGPAAPNGPVRPRLRLVWIAGPAIAAVAYLAAVAL